MLINCPNCGKPISDKADACIHCGYVLQKEPEVKEEIKVRNFTELSKAGQAQVMADFAKEMPYESGYIKTSKIIRSILIVSLLIYVTSVMIGGIGFAIILNGSGRELEKVIEYCFSIFLIFFVLSFILLFILVIIDRVRRKKTFALSKKLQAWAKTKGIDIGVNYLATSAREAKEMDRKENL